HAAVLKAFGNPKATDAQVKKVIGLFEGTGSIKHAKDIALDYAARAKAKLDCLPESKDKRFLGALVDFSVGRES
ncbi:MAG: hypothetical protein LUQ39_01080, partial [Methanomassiliicoccales archaeon]|nr:hypothetical protein [Methanomassiliicoccales archaeon]